MHNSMFNRWAFRLTTIVAPVAIAALLEFQHQIDGGTEIQWRPIVSAVIASGVIAWANFTRAYSESMEREKEIETSEDQDADHMVEQPEGDV